MDWPIDSAVDGLGNPLGSILTVGQDSDIIQGLNPEMVIADQAYEANDLIQMIPGMGVPVVILVHSNRNQQLESDDHWYKDRNLVDRFCNQIKQFVRLARRDEKLDRNFMSRFNLVSTIICLAWMLTVPRISLYI